MIRVRTSWLASLGSLVIASLSPAQTFQDVTIGSGLEGAPMDDSVYPDGIYGVGMCAIDFDKDGDVDLFVGGGNFNGTQHKLYRNDGGMHFTDVTANAGFGPNLALRAAQSADVDNDGDEDLLLCNWRQPVQLYLNDGNGSFVEAATQWGLTDQVTSAWGATFGDFDRDGRLDLYIANRFAPGYVPQPSILYHNTGSRFEQVFAGDPVCEPTAATLFAVFLDFDGDGWQDIYTVNDKGSSYGPNKLFRFDGSRFTNVSAQYGITDAPDGMGFDFVDAFNDGGIDFYCSDVGPDHVFRVWNDSLRSFENGTYTYGVPGGFTGWAIHFQDFDNDAWSDLHVTHMGQPNFLYRNPAQPAAAHVPWIHVANPISPHWIQLCTLAADFDNDGRVDLLHRFVRVGPFGAPPRSLALHRNVSAPDRHWISIETVGTSSNRNGFGAKIEVRAGGVDQRKFRRHGVGFIGGNDHRVHFGLADASVVDELVVTWPSGCVQKFYDVEPDRVVTVVEPKMGMTGNPTVGGACIIDLATPSEAGKNFAIMLSMARFPKTPLPDGRSLPIRVDGLTALSLTPGNALLHGNVAPLHRGNGGGLLTVPNLAALSGLRLYATGITFDADGIGTVFPSAVEVVIQ
ncbi:MAG: CRTAC1 family protein [Planctomycetes bacterium]|nr:CRTAC1 family protein [Planctomycetota bacterium]